MKVTYDHFAGALYIELCHLPEGQTVDTVEVEDDGVTLIDFLADGTPHGIEVIFPERFWPLADVARKLNLTFEEVIALARFCPYRPMTSVGPCVEVLTESMWI